MDLNIELTGNYDDSYLWEALSKYTIDEIMEVKEDELQRGI